MSSIVQIKDSAYDGLKSLTVYGNTVQNLWVNPSGTQNGLTVTANADGSITVSGTLNASSASLASAKVYTLKPNATYTVSVDRIVGSTINTSFFVQQMKSDGTLATNNRHFGYGDVASFTITTNRDMAYCLFGFFVRPSGTTVSGTYRVMLNEGSKAEPWCPPGLNSVGDGGSVKVVTAGKNLLKTPSNSITDVGVSVVKHDDGSITFNGTATDVFWSYDIALDFYLPSGTYTLSGFDEWPESMRSNVRVESLYKPWSRNVGRLMELTDPTGTVKDGEPHYFRFVIQAPAGSEFDNVTIYPQLELGSTATAYEPLAVTTTPIDLQGHTLNALPDGTRDELHIDGGGNVVLEKRTQRVTFEADGWSIRSDSGNFVYGDAYDSANLNPASPIGAPYDNILCDKYYASNVSNHSQPLNSIRKLYAGDNMVCVVQNGTQPVDDITVVYQLKDPQTIDLGTIDLPKLRKKPLVNTIWANDTAGGTGFSLAPEIDCEYNRWSTYCDGFKTHGKHSYFDMGCCIAARDTGTPEKKSVTATVPYMSGFYDLSKLYGAIAFEARQLMYRFEFVEDSREELQQKKSQFLEWLSQVHDEEIADDDIPGRHFIGSLSEWEFEEGEEGQSGSLEVTFNCQPFLEADEDTTKTCNAGSNTVTVEGQAVNAYAKTSSGTATIQIGGVTQSVGTTEIRLSVQLQPGDNAVTVTGSPVVLRWRELTA